MTNEEIKKVHNERLHKAAEYYGLQMQAPKAVKELGELIVLLGKMQYDEVEHSALVNEIAGCYNLLDQLCILLDCEQNVRNLAQYKMLNCVNGIENDEK